MSIDEQEVTAKNIFLDSGEMGALMHSLDWVQTPLGAVETWSQSLRVSLSILLASHCPMYIAWGQDFVQFYNDAYCLLLDSTQHPTGLGQRASECFSDTWETIAPVFERVMAGEKVTLCENQRSLLHQTGSEQDCHLTFSYSPIPDDGGRVGGVLVAVTKTAHRIPNTEQQMSANGQAIGTAFDTSEAERDKIVHQRAERMLLEQRRLLELIALGQPLDECLAAVCVSMSRLCLGTRACFLLTDAQRLTFSRSITPDFPLSFGQGLKDASIDKLASGTCGMAVYWGKSVTCADIAHDDRWSHEWQDLCEVHGVLACHSAPVRGVDGLPLGLLMLCFEEARSPSDWEQQLAEFGTHVASVVFERDRSNLALRASEAKYRTLFESIEQGFCICEMLFDENGASADYRFLEVNLAFERLTGLDQAIGKTARELFPNLQADWFEVYGTVVQTGESVQLERQSIALNRWFDVNAFCMGEPPSNLFAILFTDISDRKMVEQERDRFLAVGSDLQIISSSNGYFQWVSPTFERLLGWTLAEMTSRPWIEFVHPDDIPKSVAEIDRLFSGSETFAFENRYRHKDGSYRWFLWNAQSYLEEQIVYGTAVDITERVQVEETRKRTEQTLRDSEEQSRNILESITDAFFAVDENWRFTYVNQTAYTLFNHTPDDLIGKSFWEQFPGGDESEFELMHRRVMRDRVAESLTAFYPDHDRWYEVRSCPAVNGITLYFRNVTDQIQAEEALRQSEARFRRIFECKMVPMAVWTATGGIVEANDALLNLIGYTRQELAAGQVKWQALTPPEYQHLDERAFSDVTTQGFFTAYEKVFIHKDGRLIPILIGGASFLDEINSGVFFAIDLSDRKQAKAALQEQTQLLQLILSSIGDGLILANQQGELLLFNQAAERIFGRLTTDQPCEEWSRTYGLFLPDQQTFFPEQQLPLYRAMQGEYANDVEVFVRRNPMSEGRWISISGFPVRDRSGEVTGGVITCRDISERKRMMQQEQAARQEAERANRIKDEFLAVLSHELRSPLNPILGWTRLLQKGKLNEARRTEALKTIERNAKLQSQLIEDLLDISRIMQGKLSLTASPVSLPFVISAAVETVQLAAEAKDIQIILDLDAGIAPISGDPARLQQVVWNLLANAVKFSPRGGQVIVELKHINRLAQIRVIDAGKGIQPQFLPHVFEYFRQEDGSTTRKFGGLGLGLAIVQQIVEMHGGAVWAESQGENQGATFIVQLPAELQVVPILSELDETQTNSAIPLDNVQILLVDDDTDTREFQAFLLEQNGAKVTAVASGLEALQALDCYTPNVLVSDVGMSEMDGYMLMEQIRSRLPNQGGTVPAIALTAYATEIDQQKALQAGFQTHLTKPVEAEELVKAILSSLESN